MWLRDCGNPGFQSLNFQGLNLPPYNIQPRLDSSLLGLQPDRYLQVNTAPLVGIPGPAKHLSPSMLQFQPHALDICNNQQGPVLSSHMVSQVQPSQAYLQSQVQFMQSQVPQEQELVQKPPISCVVPTFSETQNYSDPNLNALPVLSHDVPKPTPVPVSNPWSLKRVALESGFTSMNPIEQLNTTLESVLPSMDPQNNNSFATNMNYSLSGESGLTSLRNVVNNDDGIDPNHVPFSTCDFLSSTQDDFTLNQALAGTGCLEESGFLSTHENIDQVNPVDGIFVKVCLPFFLRRNKRIRYFHRAGIN
jgi:hypothetical protein